MIIFFKEEGGAGPKRCPQKKIMKYTLKVNELKNSVQKLTGFVKDTVVFDLTGRKTKEEPDKYYAKIRACNGTAQALSVCTYSGDTENVKMIFTNQILNVIDSLSVFGDELVIEPGDGAASVSCGTANANVPYAPDAASIESPDMKKEPTLVLQFKKEDFQNAVQQGAFVQEEGNNPAMSKTVNIKPCMKDGKRTVKFSSATSQLYAECECPVAIQDAAAELFEQWTAKSIIVKSPALSAISRSVTSDTILVCITDKQLVINAGKEVYNFVAVEGNFINLQKIIDERNSKDFEMKIDKNKFKSAFKVIGLYAESNDSNMVAAVTMEELEGGKVKVVVKDENDKNRVEFEAEGFGNKELRLNKPQVSRALDGTEGDVVSIHGTDAFTIIFISGSNENAFCFNATAANKK